MSWTDYKRLIDQATTDPEAWEAAYNGNPNDPRSACVLAVQRSDPGLVADLLQRFALQVSYWQTEAKTAKEQLDQIAELDYQVSASKPKPANFGE